MSECGIYSITLTTDAERVFCLVYAKKRREAEAIAFEQLNSSFFQVDVAFALIPWLDLDALPVTHIGDSMTTNITYADGQHNYTNTILTCNAHLRGRRASVQVMEKSVTIWLGTCLHHVPLQLTGGANYYIATTNGLTRNAFLNEIMTKHDTELEMPQQLQSAATLQSAASSLRPTMQYCTNGVTVKIEMMTLILNRGSVCLAKDTM